MKIIFKSIKRLPKNTRTCLDTNNADCACKSNRCEEDVKQQLLEFEKLCREEIRRCEYSIASNVRHIMAKNLDSYLAGCDPLNRYTAKKIVPNCDNMTKCNICAAILEDQFKIFRNGCEETMTKMTVNIAREYITRNPPKDRGSVWERIKDTLLC